MDVDVDVVGGGCCGSLFVVVCGCLWLFVVVCLFGRLMKDDAVAVASWFFFCFFDHAAAVLTD